MLQDAHAGILASAFLYLFSGVLSLTIPVAKLRWLLAVTALIVFTCSLARQSNIQPRGILYKIDKTTAAGGGGIFFLCLTYAIIIQRGLTDISGPAWAAADFALVCTGLALLNYTRSNTAWIKRREKCKGGLLDADPVVSLNPFVFVSDGKWPGNQSECEMDEMMYGLYHTEWHFWSGTAMLLATVATIFCNKT